MWTDFACHRVGVVKGGLSPPQHAMHDAFSTEHVVDSAVRASQGQGAGQGVLMSSEGAVCLQVFEG